MKRSLGVVLGAVLGGILTSCSTGEEPADTPSAASGDPGFGHVHGLGYNPGDGLVYAATHFGVFRLDPAGPTRVADRYQDTMGFTVAGPDRFLGSGHPDMREDMPAHLGLVLSTDRAETWQPLSLQGEVDFHALAAAGDTVYGWDATSDRVLRSDDAGKTWVQGPELAVTDIAVDPADPTHVLAAAGDGLLESTDAGLTFVPVDGQPPEVLAYVRYWGAPDFTHVVGVDAIGRTWARRDGQWTEVGSLPGAPEAFTVAGDGLLGATATGVFESLDGGATWQLLEPSTGQD